MNEILEAYNKSNAFGRFFKMTYHIDSPGNVIYSMEVTKDLLATVRTMHGGALAGMMDAVVGVAALSVSSLKGKVVSTVEIKINYLRPVVLNDQLTGKGTVISEGNRIIVCKGEIYNQNHELVAIATSTMNAYSFSKM